MLNVENIFKEFLERESIFKDKSLLSLNFIPNQILHRENEINQLKSILAPVLKGYKPSNIFIYGTCGTGKTVTTLFVLNQLNEIIEQQKLNVKTIYVNCKMKKVADTEYRMFAHLLKEFGITVPDTGLPTNVLYRKFFDLIEENNLHLILILDEIDVLFRKTGDDFLYNLTRITMENGDITLIGITNDVTFSEQLDRRVKSSLMEEEIIFKPYTASQLKDILMQRIEAFKEGVISEGVINKCAALAAQEHGDARKAIELLRVAGEIAERNGDTKVEERHVDLAQEYIDLDTTMEIVKAQPLHSQLVLYTILQLTKEKPKLLTGEIYDAYRKYCEEIKIKPLTQRRVSDLIGELDMLGLINAKVISKGRYGRTREVSLLLSTSLKNRIESFLHLKFF